MSAEWTIHSVVHLILPLIVLGLGALQLWRGLLGQPGGEGGLVRRHSSALGRMEGFRTTMTGIVLVLVGTGWLAQDRLLIFLGLGLGIVELRESTLIINAVKFSRPSTPSASGNH
jgi:hypothetical protein